MAAHRYWRLLLRTNYGNPSYFGIAEIRAYDVGDTGATNNLAPLATFTATESYGGTSPSALNDDNTSNFWASNGTFPIRLTMDFGSGNAYDLGRFDVYPRDSGSYTQSPTSGEIFYSDNGTDWTYYKSFSNPTWSPSTEQTLTLSTDTRWAHMAGGHRYWRLYATAVGVISGDVDAALVEWYLYDNTAGDPSGEVAELATVFSASSIYSGGYAAAYAVDRNPSTFWNSGSGQGVNSWIMADFGEEGRPVIRRMDGTARSDIPARAPISGYLQYSDDGTTWTNAASYSGMAWTSGQTQMFATVPLSFVLTDTVVVRGLKPNGEMCVLTFKFFR